MSEKVFFGNEIAAGSSPLTGVVSLLVGFLACLAGVDKFASGGFLSLDRSEEILIIEKLEIFFLWLLLDLEQSLKRLSLGRS